MTYCVFLLQYDKVVRGHDAMDREALQNIQEDLQDNFVRSHT